MSASAVDRRHARQVELAMEIVASELEEQDLDRRSDAMHRRLWTFIHALDRWLQQVMGHVRGGARAYAFLIGIVDAIRGEEALEQVDDARRERELAAARELAGLLDGNTSQLEEARST
jgi:hypothetical protein